MSDLQFADIHCHPILYAINRMRNDPQMENNPEVYHPWHEFDCHVGKMASGAQAARYSQASMARLVEGNVGLIFASFTPIEKGFFVGGDADDETSFLLELHGWLTGRTPLRAAKDLLSGDVDAAARRALAILRNRGPFRQILQSLVMDYRPARVQFIMSDAYDYWVELHEEYEFLKKYDGKEGSTEIDTVDGKRRVQGSYRIVSDTKELEESFEKVGEVATVLTIEGGHVFSLGPDQKPVSTSVIEERIAALRQWEHPVLFLTLAHHFDNGLCGHAHSILDAGNWLMDQQKRLNEDLDPQRGLFTVRELLDLDEELRDRGDRRILVDVRHMSARSRKTYYGEIVEPYNRWRLEQPGRYRRRYPQIPVIMSHGGYSGVSTLDDLIADEDREGDRWHRDGFYAWNINLCDEDIVQIHATGGLAGLIFDRRILGVGPGQKIPDEFWPDVVMRQIFSIVDVIMLDDRLKDEQKRTIWDCICLGTDFDGFIHPVKCYPTALELQQFGRDLRRRLEEQRHTRMIDEIGVETIVEKLAFRNAYDFARQHLPAAAGQTRTKKVAEEIEKSRSRFAYA